MVITFVVIAVFVCIAGLGGSVALLLRDKELASVEDRLTSLTSEGPQVNAEASRSFLSSFADRRGAIEEQLAKFIDLRTMLEQAGMSTHPDRIILLSIATGVVTGCLWLLVGMMPWFGIFIGLAFASLPLCFVAFKKSRRLRKFGAQLPEALELISRALRAGHSLPAGFHLVGEHMNEPIGPEFGRCFDEQNLGIPLEEALEELTRRVPNVDLRFFATAVIIQRQTGGDLAEILDKISKLIRERFQIWGQIQALTGEGRLSGIVLLALPPALFLVMLRINYDYIMKLFEEPLGHKMVLFAIVMQLVGAYAIRKIVDIKV
ncbi:MAG: type II secretion system F family protein [Planctomycetota bacterium]|nr:type II secretion system F family protein [Planctomycetota bacterium]